MCRTNIKASSSGIVLVMQDHTVKLIRADRRPFGSMPARCIPCTLVVLCIGTGVAHWACPRCFILVVMVMRMRQGSWLSLDCETHFHAAERGPIMRW